MRLTADVINIIRQKKEEEEAEIIILKYIGTIGFSYVTSKV
jgi:hypothetical protein